MFNVQGSGFRVICEYIGVSKKIAVGPGNKGHNIWGLYWDGNCHADWCRIISGVSVL